MGIPRPHIVVIGGGISGLTAAYGFLEESRKTGLHSTCTVLETSQRWGGKIQSRQWRNLVIEEGPDSFLSVKPWAIQLCEELGLADQLVNTNEDQGRTFCFTRGKLRELPQGLVAFIPTKLGPFLSSGIMSWLGILRMGAEWFVPPSRRTDEDETIASFFCRRMGREAFERFIEPLVAGIYAGDAQELSIKATFPRFVELEQRHGGLIRGLLAQRRLPPQNPSRSESPRRTMFTTLRGGLGDLVEALRVRIASNGGRLQGGAQVINLEMTGSSPSRYRVVLANHEAILADGVIVATPAYSAGSVLRTLCEPLTELLNQIPYASTATVTLSYQREAVASRIRGFGFIVPRIEGKSLIAATWSSLKWPCRSSSQHVVLRCYVGGRGREAILSKDDGDITQYVQEELRRIVGIDTSPVFTHLARWDQSMPQYTPGHLERVKAIQERLTSFPRLALTGAAYHGIGIPDCVRDGMQSGTGLAQALK